VFAPGAASQGTQPNDGTRASPNAVPPLPTLTVGAGGPNP